MDKAKERLQRIIRTEIYANKVKQLFFDTVSEITALSKSLPVLEEGVMFSFEGENRKKQLQVERALRKLHSFATVAIEQGIDLEWEEANKTCDELLSTQFGKASLQSPFFKAWTLRNHDVRDAFAKRTDNGMNLSQRIWKYVDQFRDEMEIAMTVAITEGESASEMSRKVRQYLQDPDLMFRRFRYKVGEDADGNPIYGKKWKKKVRDDNGKVRWIDYDKDSYEVGKGMYKSAYKNAMRVARTETNMAYRKADNVRWQQMDFVVGQRISLSKKHPCEDICDDLVGEYPKSFVFTGWHPQCFCYVTPILGDEDEMAKITDAFLDGKDYEPQFEQLEEYPKGFENWVKDHKTQIEKSIKQGKEPYFIKDNMAVVDNMLTAKEIKSGNNLFTVYKTYSNGGIIQIMKGIDRTAIDYKPLLTVARVFAEQGKKVQITNKVHYKSQEYSDVFGRLFGTKYERKCPDLIIDGLFYEYEGYIKPWKKRKVKNMISHGLAQSDRIIIDNNRGCSDRFIRRAVYDRKNLNNQKIEEVWLYEKGKVRLLYQDKSKNGEI